MRMDFEKAISIKINVLDVLKKNDFAVIHNCKANSKAYFDRFFEKSPAEQAYRLHISYL